MKKRVIAVFDVEYEDDGHWTPSDIALGIELHSSDWTNATVWNSIDDLLKDAMFTVSS